MEISKLSDSSLVDFVGIDNNAMPIPTDPIALFAFVCKFTASKLEEVEAAVKRSKEEFSRPKRVSISARQLSNEVSVDYGDDDCEYDHATKKKKSSSRGKNQFEFASWSWSMNKASSHVIKDELKSSSNRKTSGSFAPRVIKDKLESNRKTNNIYRVIKDKLESNRKTNNISRVIEDTPESSRERNTMSRVESSRMRNTMSRVIEDKPESSRKRKNISRVIKDKPESSRKRKKPKPPANTGPEPPPDLPDNYKRLVKNVGGENPVLFIQKRLFATDLEKNNNRLSIPVNAIRNDYLTDEEKALLETRYNDNHTVPIEANLWDPKENKWTINLRKWDMKGNEKPKATKMYNLSKPWYVIVEKNTWAIGDLIQLWAFRIEGKLAFVLVNLPERGEPAKQEAC